MTTHPQWNDEYWLLLLQLYLRKPEGVKPLYSRALVDLSLELHIPPQLLYDQMTRLRTIDTPRLKQLWDTYAHNPRKLSRMVKLLRQKAGYGNADSFYRGVELQETFEKDFKPLSEEPLLTPVKLIMILDLYFRLIPITMTEDTPEVQQLARQLRITPRLIVEVMEIYLFLDPYLNRADIMIHPLLTACQEVWTRFANGNPSALAALAAQLKDYFK